MEFNFAIFQLQQEIRVRQGLSAEHKEALIQVSQWLIQERDNKHPTGKKS